MHLDYHYLDPDRARFWAIGRVSDLWSLGGIVTGGDGLVKITYKDREFYGRRPVTAR